METREGRRTWIDAASCILLATYHDKTHDARYPRMVWTVTPSRAHVLGVGQRHGRVGKRPGGAFGRGLGVAVQEAVSCGVSDRLQVRLRRCTKRRLLLRANPDSCCAGAARTRMTKGCSVTLNVQPLHPGLLRSGETSTV